MSIQNKYIALALIAVVIAGGIYIVIQQSQIASLNKKVGKLTQPAPPSQTTASSNNTDTGAQNAAQIPPINDSNAAGGSTTTQGKTSTTPSKPANTSPTVTPTGGAARDAKRISNMRQLVSAQEMWYNSNNRYYTCSITGGDCKGKTNNYPASIGTFIKNVVDPLNSGVGCGEDYTYCALDNTVETNKFCYYAKLEGGGYYTASHAGNFKRATPPLSFDECAGAYPNGGNPADSGSTMTTPQSRDARRLADMRQLVSAQEMWYGSNNRYYTCGPSGGDCKGANHNYPAAIGTFLPNMPVDPTNSGSGCGRDLIYCGLDNISENQKFCFFAKLEGGGYYTASQAGDFKRSTAPATLADCGLPN